MTDNSFITANVNAPDIACRSRAVYLETKIAFRDSAVIKTIKIISFSPPVYLGASETFTLLSPRR